MDIEKIKELREEHVDVRSTNFEHIKFTHLPRMANPTNKKIMTGPPHELYLLKNKTTNEIMLCLRPRGEELAQVLSEEKIKELKDKFSYKPELSSLFTLALEKISLEKSLTNHNTTSNKVQKI